MHSLDFDHEWRLIIQHPKQLRGLDGIMSGIVDRHCGLSRNLRERSRREVDAANRRDRAGWSVPA
jgi:hypothetical protein